MKEAMKEAKEVKVSTDLRKAKKMVSKYSRILSSEEKHEETQTTKKEKVDAVKAYDMLTKMINEKIEKEEDKRDFEAATKHKRQLQGIKREWEQIDRILKAHTAKKDQEDKERVDRQWDEMQKKQLEKRKESSEETCSAANKEHQERLRRKIAEHKER